MRSSKVTKRMEKIARLASLEHHARSRLSSHHADRHVNAEGHSVLAASTNGQPDQQFVVWVVHHITFSLRLRLLR